MKETPRGSNRSERLDRLVAMSELIRTADPFRRWRNQMTIVERAVDVLRFDRNSEAHHRRVPFSATSDKRATDAL